MKMIFRSLLAMSCAVLLLPGVAGAQQKSLTADQKQAALERLHAADANQDGFIDKAEADASLPRVSKRFDTLDSNGDGRLSPEEFRAMASKFAARGR